MRQDQAFSHGTCSSLRSFFIDFKIVKYFNEFCITIIFKFHCIIDNKQLIKNRVKQGTWKSDNIFHSLKIKMVFL